MRRRAHARRTVAQLPGAAARERDQLLHRTRRQRRVHDQRQHEARDLRHPPEIAKRIDRRVRAQALDRSQARCGQQQRVAVGRLLRDILPCDQAAGAGPVVDDHLLADGLADRRRDQARDQIVRTAGRRADDQPHRLCGKTLCERDQRRSERAGGKRSEKFATFVHSITFSAVIRSDCGILRPNALAVLPLMNNSNFVGCSTGRSPGLAPLKILST